MSDEKKYTERDMVLARREGARKMAARCIITEGGLLPLYKMCNIELDQEIARMFPLPKVTRPRRVDGESRQYQVVKTELYYRLRGDPTWTWDRCRSLPVVDAKLVADLLANPTEEITE